MPFAEDDTSSPEHERHAVFTSRLAALESLPNDLLESLIAEAAADPDVAMGGSVLALIAEHRLLSGAQRSSLLSHPQYQQPFLQHRIRRATLLMLLGAPSLSDDLLAQCIAFPDAPVHRALLSHPAIGHPHLAALRDHGANRAIRKIAAQRLKAHAHSQAGPNPGMQRTRYARR